MCQSHMVTGNATGYECSVWDQTGHTMARLARSGTGRAPVGHRLTTNMGAESVA